MPDDRAACDAMMKRWREQRISAGSAGFKCARLEGRRAIGFRRIAAVGALSVALGVVLLAFDRRSRRARDRPASSGGA